MTTRGSVHDRPRPSGRRRGRKVGSSTAHWTSVRSMPSSTTAILPMFQAASVFMRQLLESLRNSQLRVEATLYADPTIGLRLF
jgi:hypothetical protein